MAIVEVDKLVKRYKGAQTNAVDGVSFSIEPGEFFAVLGPNGAGKTTTISILTTTLAPTSGLVRVGDCDVTREASHVRRDVVIILQRPSLDLNLTAEENVRLHTFLYGLYLEGPFVDLAVTAVLFCAFLGLGTVLLVRGERNR